jgi:hypothetical protein
MRRLLATAAILLLALTLGACVATPPPTHGTTASTKEPPSDAESSEEDAPSYEEIIADAETQKGLIMIHHKDDKWWWELPTSLLGREILWYSELAKAPAEYDPFMDSLEIGSRMVRFERRGDVVDVKDLSAQLKKRGAFPGEPGKTPTPDEESDPVAVSLENANYPATLMTLPIVAEGPAGSMVLDVTELFSADIPDFSPTFNLEMGGIMTSGSEPDRSYIVAMRAFPENANVETHLTFSTEPEGGAELSAASVAVRHSLTLLPREPMMPRYADPRVGYFTQDFADYGGLDANTIVERGLIERYRLEKKNPEAEMSDPIEPIVYYVAPDVPEKWHSYVKQGIEDWQAAFEAAGFSNAIIAKDAPTPAEDPAWSPSDTRYSVIRWISQPIANAMGPSIVDPRSGEILAAHVVLWADILNITEQWYFTQVGGHDESVQLPLNDAVMGQLVRYIVAHEVGHTLGLSHNHRASQVYSIEQLRDPEFTAANGAAPSIMSYGRFNYIAQPGDGVTNYIPQIGPYDRFAINWGYRPIPGIATPADEVATLREWAAVQATDPTLAFGGEDAAADVDPNVLMENLGSDRIEATRLGILNLERLMKRLVDATTEPGGNFDQLSEMYSAMLDQRREWLSSVIKLVGGVEESRTMAGGGAQFSRVSRERQREAVAFVMQNLVNKNGFLPAEVLNLTSPASAIADYQSEQKAMLDSLLSETVFAQLADGEALSPEDSYSGVELLTDVQAILFADLTTGGVAPDPILRDLQHAYMSTIRSRLESPPLPEIEGFEEIFLSVEPRSDFRAAARFALSELRTSLLAAPAATPAAQAQVLDLLTEIEEIVGAAANDREGSMTNTKPVVSNVAGGFELTWRRLD